MDDLDALAAPLLLQQPADEALQRRLRDSCAAFAEALELACRARQLSLQRQPRAAPRSLAAEARRAWEGRLASRLRTVLREGLTAHFPESVASDRVPRVAARLASAEVAAIESFEPGSGAMGGEATPGADELQQMVEDVVRDRELLLSLRLAPPQAAAGGSRVRISADALVEFIAEQLHAASEKNGGGE
jgi:hypothetical protein